MMGNMTTSGRSLFSSACALFVAAAISNAVFAQTSEKPAGSAQAKVNAAPVTIESAFLGDSADGVVTRITLRFTVPEEVAPQIPLVVQGSIMQAGKVVRNFRYPLRDSERGTFSFVQTLPEGNVEIEARVMVPVEEETPIIVAKSSATVAVAKTNQSYIATEAEGAEGIIAEGIVPETTGAIRILPPRRKLAMNLFLVDVEVKDPVKRVEFFVEGKKIFTKNAPPYKAELDLGTLPKQVEVRVVGYDASGRYVDADAWIVNERDNPMEVKITRTTTPDDVSHFKISIQNLTNKGITSVALYANDDKLFEWKNPPYAVDVPNRKLSAYQFVRVAAINSDGLEASDLLFLDGNRFMEEVEVNFVELPVTALDPAGVPALDLKIADFQVLEDKKPKKISAFNLATNLPLSVGLLLDHSGSMEKRIGEARDASVRFFETILGQNDRAFFGGFAWEVKSVSPFVTSVETLRAQVGQMPKAEGGTAIYDAIVSGLYKFRSVPGRKALVLVTDGEDTVSRIPYDQMLTYVRASRVPLYFVGIGLSAFDFSATSKMKALAAETGGVAYFPKNIEELKRTYEQLKKELRSQYLIGYYTDSSKSDRKYRTVEVKTTRTNVRIRTIRGFIP